MTNESRYLHACVIPAEAGIQVGLPGVIEKLQFLYQFSPVNESWGQALQIPLKG